MAAGGGGPGESEAAEKGANAEHRGGEACAARSREAGGGQAAARGGECVARTRRHTPPLAGGLNARGEPPPPPPPPPGVALSPRFPSARLSWQPPRLRSSRPARGGPAPQLGSTAESVGSGLALRPERAAPQPEVSARPAVHPSVLLGAGADHAQRLPLPTSHVPVVHPVGTGSSCHSR